MPASNFCLWGTLLRMLRTADAYRKALLRRPATPAQGCYYGLRNIISFAQSSVAGEMGGDDGLGAKDRGQGRRDALGHFRAAK